MLLLEAGPPDTNPWIHIPLGFAQHLRRSEGELEVRERAAAAAWQPAHCMCRAARRWAAPARSTAWSICAAITATTTSGASAAATAGTGIRVLPYFRKAENQARGEDEFHGVGGPLHVSDQPATFELAEAVIAGREQAGIPRNPDFNGAQQEGVRLLPDDDQRRPALEHGAKPIWSRRAAGRTSSSAPAPRDARADRERPRRRRRIPHAAGPRRRRGRSGEVIVSGGAYGSPQLLLLSGLGPGAASAGDGHRGGARHAGGRRQSARPFQHLPAPGAAPRPITLNDLENSWPRKIGAAHPLCADPHRARWRVNGIHAGLFTRSDPRLERPDLQINMLEWSTLERDSDRRRCRTRSRASRSSPVHLRPDGRGTVRLNEPDPLGAAGDTVRLPADGLRHAGDDGRHPAGAQDRRSSRR